MKLSRGLFVVALLIVGLVSAPSAWASAAFGVKGGLNLANVSVDPEPSGVSFDMRTGIGVGGDIEFSLSASNKLTLRADVLYMMKGTKYNEDGVDPNYGAYTIEATYKLDELVVAPFLVFRFPSGGATPFIQVGPELGFNLTHKYDLDYEFTDQNVSGSESGDIEDWASMNFGLNFGGGVAIPAGKGEVLFDARYNLGLKNMYTGTGDETDKTNGIQFLIGYNFTVPTR